jgi:dolichol-phosphate mannosyltransferase
MPTLSIMTPVYYNEGSLPLLYQKFCEIERQLAEIDFQLQLVFVDDGSGDNSYEELRKIKADRPETTVIKLTRNFGAIGAVKVGLEHIRGDCFIFVAADLQDPPELIVDMVRYWQQGWKYVIATRRTRQDPWSSKVWSGVYYRVLRRFVITDYPETGFDLALMDKMILPHMQGSGKYMNPPLYSYWLGFEPKVIPYDRQERKHGRSRWTFAKKLTLFLDSILSFTFIPIRFITSVGFIVSLLSFGYGIVVVVSYLLGRVPEEAIGWSSIITLISFLLGLVLVMLGIIGEYVWRIFEEVNKRPVAVIEEIL